ncbi:PhzF family phenazine biosynthesis protein [Aestuariivivens sediminis]|uniref:PhzF family phenazine biosynthesis protein n=1 Tax=Aestuariivivens sediminis TaxID=2913557 RepID=UPI001F577A24|nr:PhzF family phenazine biosynthesis protein [Aestuariivivens sediminis]
MDIDYYLVDVFTKNPFSGNGLAIFPNAVNLDKKAMLLLTQEMRQFESIFYYQKSKCNFQAFIFTIEEELDFAGHPLLGLAALVHEMNYKNCKKSEINVELNNKTVDLITSKNNGYYTAIMNQGSPEFIYSLNESEEMAFLSFLSLEANDKYQETTLEVVSNGLPYLIVPVKASSFTKIKISISDLENKLSKVGAKFLYVLDIENNRGRTFDNKGKVEDIATGSAAGPVGAYLIKNGFEKFNSIIKIKQGEFLNRESEIRLYVKENNGTFGDILVEGDVVHVASGKIKYKHLK